MSFLVLVASLNCLRLYASRDCWGVTRQYKSFRGCSTAKRANDEENPGLPKGAVISAARGSGRKRGLEHTLQSEEREVRKVGVNRRTLRGRLRRVQSLNLKQKKTGKNSPQKCNATCSAAYSQFEGPLLPAHLVHELLSTFSRPLHPLPLALVAYNFETRLS